MTLEHRIDLRDVLRAHLHDCPELFTEETGSNISHRTQVHFQAAASGERHLRKRDEQAAVRSIMVSNCKLLLAQLTDGCEEVREHARIIAVRRHVPNLPVHLRETRTTQAILSCSEVNQYKRACTAIRAQLRCQRAAHVPNGGEGRND